MIAAIGTGHLPLPRQLASDTPRLTLQSIPRFGKGVDLTWQTPAHALHVKLTRTAAGLELETNGAMVLVRLQSWPMPRGRGGLHGARLRMVCPGCGSLRDVLYWVGEWGCRGKDCLNVSYDCWHRQRWCRAIARRARLLHKLARCSPKSLRGRWLRAQIGREERAMIANLKRANRDLQKRSRRYGRRGRASSSQ